MQTQHSSEIAPSPTVLSARRLANQGNARQSTGPRSDTGKRIASQNAVTHGLTSRRALLSNEDAAQYAQHCERFRRNFSPVAEREVELVQTMADAQWRLNRIPCLEMAIYAVGHCEYAHLYPEIEDPAVHRAVIEHHIFRERFRELNNLSTQEVRLQRQYDKAKIELEDLQSKRKELEKRQPKKPSAEPEIGFVFSDPAPTAPQSSLSPSPADLTSSNAAKIGTIGRVIGS